MSNTQSTPQLGVARQLNLGKNPTQQAVIHHILSSIMYTRPLEATIREYAVNAHDAVLAAGLDPAQHPIRIQIPEQDNGWTLRVSDEGIGMSAEQIEQNFCDFGDSTKLTDPIGTGELGMGAKAGFSVSDQITVTSTKDGNTCVTVLSADARGVKNSTPLAQHHTGAPAGTTVELVLSDDRRDDAPESDAMLAAVYDALGGIDHREFVVENPAGYMEPELGLGEKTVRVGPGILLRRVANQIKYISRSWDSGPAILMGSVLYPLPKKMCDPQTLAVVTTLQRGSIQMILEVPNKSLDPHPSRESVRLTAQNTAVIKEALESAMEHIDHWIQEQTQIQIDKAIAEDRRDLKLDHTASDDTASESRLWFTLASLAGEQCRASNPIDDHLAIRLDQSWYAPWQPNRGCAEKIRTYPGVRVNPLTAHTLTLVTDAAGIDTQERTLAALAGSKLPDDDETRYVTVLPGQAPSWLAIHPGVTRFDAAELVARYGEDAPSDDMDASDQTAGELRWDPEDYLVLDGFVRWSPEHNQINNPDISTDEQEQRAARVLVKTLREDSHAVVSMLSADQVRRHPNGTASIMSTRIVGEQARERLARIQTLVLQELTGQEQLRLLVLDEEASTLREIAATMPHLSKMPAPTNISQAEQTTRLLEMELRLANDLQECLERIHHHTTASGSSAPELTVPPALTAALERYPSNHTSYEVGRAALNSLAWRERTRHERGTLEHLPLLSRMIVDPLRIESVLSAMKVAGVGQSSRTRHAAMLKRTRSMLDFWA